MEDTAKSEGGGPDQFRVRRRFRVGRQSQMSRWKKNLRPKVVNRQPIQEWQADEANAIKGKTGAQNKGKRKR